jgi:hypothetical protein
VVIEVVRIETRAAEADQVGHLQDRCKARPAGEVQAADEATAIEKGAAEFKVAGQQVDGGQAMSRSQT